MGNLIKMANAEELQRRLAELEDNECRIQQALKLSATAFCHHDRDLRYTWIYNPHMGFLPEQVIGKTDWEILEPELADRMGAYKKRVLATGLPMRVDVPTRLDDPEAEVFDLRIEPIFDADGAVVGLSCSGVNVTELKRAEAARRQQGALLRDAHDLAQRDEINRDAWRTWADAMDRLSIGIMVTNGSGLLINANRVAAKLLDDGRCIGVSHGCLRPECGVEGKALMAAISAAAAGDGTQDVSECLIALPCLDTVRPISALVLPAKQQMSMLESSEPLAIIYIASPDGAHSISPAKIAKAYALTAAESRLAAAVVNGESLKEYADRVGISVQTAKSQLKQVFSKVGIRRQSELVRDILSNPLFKIEYDATK